MCNSKIFLFSHVNSGTKTIGSTDILISNLVIQKKEFYLVEHDLNCRRDTFVFFYDKKGEKKRVQRIQYFLKNKSRYIYDCLVNASIVRKYGDKRNNILVCINPVNALSGRLIKKRGDAFIFFSVDYTKKRFGITILDKFYCWLDHYVASHADYVFNVSTRIRRMRQEDGILEDKNIFLPNIPSEEILTQLQTTVKEENTIVSVGELSEQMSYVKIFKAIKKLKDRNLNIKYNIIGGGRDENKFRQCIKEMNLEDHVKFFGWLEHAEALKIIARSKIGIANYSGALSFNYYGDSMKIREYAGLGLPTITTDTHSTVDDVKKFKAGIVVKDHADVLAETIYFLLKEENYIAYSKGAKEMTMFYTQLYKDLIKRYLL